MNHLVPVLLAHVLERLVPCNSSIVDQDVNLSKSVHRLLDHLAHLLVIGDIRLDDQRPRSVLQDLVSECQGRVGTRAVVNDNIGPCFCQFFGNGTANTPSCPGHDRRFSIQSLAHFCSPFKTL